MEMNNQQVSRLEQTVARIEERLCGFEKQLSGALNRIDEGVKRDMEMHEIRRLLEVFIGEMRGWQANIEAQIGTINARLATHGKEIDELKLKPGKRWDGLVGNIISLITGAIIAFIVAQLGMK